MNSPNQFAYLKQHLTYDERRRQLLRIESRLVEHALPPQVVLENTSYCNVKCIHWSQREMQRPQRHLERWLSRLSVPHRLRRGHSGRSRAGREIFL